MFHTIRSVDQPVYCGPGYGAISLREKENGSELPIQEIFFTPGSPDIYAVPISRLLEKHPDERAQRHLRQRIQQALNQGARCCGSLYNLQYTILRLIQQVLENEQECIHQKPDHSDYIFHPRQSFYVATPRGHGLVHTRATHDTAHVYAQFSECLPFVKAENLAPRFSKGNITMERKPPREAVGPDLCDITTLAYQTNEDVQKTLCLLNGR